MDAGGGGGVPRGSGPPTPSATARGFADPCPLWYNTAAKGRLTRGEALLAAVLIRINHCEREAGRKLASRLVLAVDAERESWVALGDAWAPMAEGSFAKGCTVEEALN